MTSVTTHAAYAPRPLPHMGIDWRAIYPAFPLGNPSHFGHVNHAALKLKNDGSAQLLIQREILLSQASHARNLRQSKAASGFEADLRQINHAILKEGVLNA